MEFEIEGKIYEMPDSVSEFTIKKYYSYNEVIAKWEGQEKNLEFSLKLIEAITEIEYETLYEKLSANSLQILNQKLSLINSELPKDVKEKIVIDETEFNLLDFNEQTAGEMIELENCLKAGIESNLHNFFAIIFKHPQFNLVKRRELFYNKMKIGDVHGVMLFFSNLEKDFLKGLDLDKLEKLKNQIQIFLKTSEILNQKNMGKRSTVNGTGTI